MSMLTKFRLPQVRKFFVPDPGNILFDVDLAGADAQVVAWDAGDEPLKQAFRDHAAGKGPKVHCVNSIAIFGKEFAGEDGKKEPFYGRAKAGVHLTNYGGKARTAAIALSVPVAQAEAFQRRWFELHPAIADWHERIEHALRTTRTVRNAFGFRRVYFERPNDLLPEALAWIPQSTVALVINKGYHNICRSGLPVEILLQVHDSLVGQCPIRLWPEIKPQLRTLLNIAIPYEDPLIIPTGLKTSTVSWGDCEDESWGE